MADQFSDLLRCPCGARMVLRYTPIWNRYFYGCERYPHCKNTISADEDKKPVGIVADEEIKELRKQLNNELDRWYPAGGAESDYARKTFLHTTVGKHTVIDLTAPEMRRLIHQLSSKG